MKNAAIAISIMLFFLSGMPALASVELTLLGPTRYSRSQGVPDNYRATFPAFVGQGRLLIKNGDDFGNGRINSAVFLINGKQVLDPHSFSQQVSAIDLEVDLKEMNSLDFQLRSGPSGFVTIRVVQKAQADAAAIIGPAGGVLTVAAPGSPLAGFRLVVPPGALTTEVALSIASISGLELPNNPTKQDASTCYAFELLPDGMRFYKPVVMELPWPDRDGDSVVDGTNLPVNTAQLFYLDGVISQYVRRDASVDVDRHLYLAETSHFSKWILGVGKWKAGAVVGYAIQSLPLNDLYSDYGVFQSEVAEAFQQWSEAVFENVTFVPLPEEEADILIRSIDTCVQYPNIREICEAAGIASRPYQRLGDWNYTWTVTFNTNDWFRWVAGNYAGYPPGTSVWPAAIIRAAFLRYALHEFGHTMGLPDYDKLYPKNLCPAAPGVPIMWYDACADGNPLVSLGDFDIDEVRARYGLDEHSYVETNVMPDIKIIERLRITDRTFHIDTAKMLSQGYLNARMYGDFLVYERPAQSLEEPYGGRYDGYYERGDPFPGSVQLIYAWKQDGTAFIGAKGPDDAALGTVVDGLMRMPTSERFVGTFMESQGYRKELKNLISLGFVSGLTLADFSQDSGYYPFNGDCDMEIFNRFDHPIFRLGSALYLQGIPFSPIGPVMLLWCPFDGFGAGSATRDFQLAISGQKAAYAMGIANNDNGNSSSIKINGQLVVSNNHCCQNSWRQTGWDVASVILATTTGWSQGAPMFNLAVVADDLSVTQTNQMPPGGLSNNHPPIVSKLPPGKWTRP